ncbi:MAG TPA: signal recognition particle-docking protein FtsY [Candidatus Kapabacteria bacterium]|nr:signal recognition particle-docking protein FtsY [Candidatus Kapabacteria bacterium]
MGFFDKLKFSRLKEGLAKTQENLVRKFSRILRRSRKIDDELLAEIEETLLLADVGMTTTEQIMSGIQETMARMKWSDASELRDELRREITKALTHDGRFTSPDDPFAIASDKKPFVIMIVGVNGVGKTTTIGKLANNYRTSGKHVLIGAADTFRAAANSQLEVWAHRANVDIIQQHHGADPSAVAYDTVQAAISRNADVVLIDTAGRLHNKAHLMQELEKMTRVMRKLIPDAPHEVLLALDATTGQNALQQAKEFSKVAPITGLILTKLDGTAKGGVVIALANEMKIPVKYIGVGEQIDDLQPFDPAEFAKALFSEDAFQGEAYTVEEEANA